MTLSKYIAAIRHVFNSHSLRIPLDDQLYEKGALGEKYSAEFVRMQVRKYNAQQFMQVYGIDRADVEAFADEHERELTEKLIRIEQSKKIMKYDNTRMCCHCFKRHC